MKLFSIILFASVITTAAHAGGIDPVEIEQQYRACQQFRHVPPGPAPKTTAQQQAAEATATYDVVGCDKIHAARQAQQAAMKSDAAKAAIAETAKKLEN